MNKVQHKRDFSAELRFKYSRSSGPGGQNVNKLNTKAEARFNIQDSVLLSDDEKYRLRIKLKTQITKDGELVIENQTARTQTQNKTLVVQKINLLINQALIRQKRRKPSSPTFASKRKRLEKKKQLSAKKINRRHPEV